MSTSSFSHLLRRFCCWLVVLLGGGSLPVFAQAPGPINYLPGPCTFGPGTIDLGTTGTITTISGTQSFNGTYHVKGSLYLTQGTFTFKPGTKFYFDGRQKKSASGPNLILGSHLILGPDAILDATETEFNAACNTSMWGGIQLEANQPGQQVRMNSCTIGYANYGVNILASDYSSFLDIQNCSFYHNLYHIYDDGRHLAKELGYVVSNIKNNLFYSEENKMISPYLNQVGGFANGYWSQEAVHLAPLNGTEPEELRFVGNYMLRYWLRSAT
jgi:hypothetical protein